MSDPDIIEMPQPLGIFAGELYERSRTYFEAFRRLETGQIAVLPHPSYFLATHGIELMLKAFLAAKGMEKREIRRLRHDLVMLLARCKALGLLQIEHFELYCGHMQHMNEHHDFRYPTNYRITVPTPPDLLRVIQNAEAVIGPLVEQVSLTARLQWAADTRHFENKRVRWTDE